MQLQKRMQLRMVERLDGWMSTHTGYHEIDIPISHRVGPDIAEHSLRDAFIQTVGQVAAEFNTTGNGVHKVYA